MIDYIYKVVAVDPYDNDSYEIGVFLDEKIAEYVRRKYEYTTDTSYSIAKVFPIHLDDESHHLLSKSIEYSQNRIGYFALIDGEKFIMQRNKHAFDNDILADYYDEMYNLIDKYDYFKTSVIEIDEDVHLLYTEVPYSETDTEMETEAYSKFSKYLSNK